MRWRRKPKTAAAPAGPNANEHYPAYNPELRRGGSPDSYTPDSLVYAERFCSCGSLLRIKGRVEQVGAWVEGFEHTHRDHKTASKAQCIAAREEKRRQAMGADYVPKTYLNLRVDG